MRDPRLTRGLIELRHVPGETRSAYDQIFSGPGMQQPDAVWNLVLDRLAVGPQNRLLDVACGEGRLVQLARRRGAWAYGIDLSQAAVRKSPARGAYAVANGEALPFPDGEFDRLVNFGSLEHYADPVAGAREMARVTGPDGRALFQLPNTFGLRWNVLHAWRHGDVHDDGQPIQRYGAPQQWARLLEAAGYEVVGIAGYEDLRQSPKGLVGWLAALRHPTRVLVPLAAKLPATMASMLLIDCRKPSA